jgi:hypothetical protein
MAVCDWMRERRRAMVCRELGAYSVSGSGSETVDRVGEARVRRAEDPGGLAGTMAGTGVSEKAIRYDAVHGWYLDQLIYEWRMGVGGYGSPEAGVFDGGEGCDLGVLAGTVLVENFLCLVEGYGDGFHRLMVFCSRRTSTVEVLLYSAAAFSQ